MRFEHYLEPSQRWYDVNVYSDEPGYFVAVFRDISNYKNMEINLDDLSLRLRAFIDNSPLLIGELKPGGQFYINLGFMFLYLVAMGLLVWGFFLEAEVEAK